MKREFELNHYLYYRWIQMTNVVPGEWKSIPRNTHVSSSRFFLDHHVVKKI